MHWSTLITWFPVLVATSLLGGDALQKKKRTVFAKREIKSNTINFLKARFRNIPLRHFLLNAKQTAKCYLPGVLSLPGTRANQFILLGPNHCFFFCPALEDKAVDRSIILLSRRYMSTSMKAAVNHISPTPKDFPVAE